jgi:hypothetical protein
MSQEFARPRSWAQGVAGSNPVAPTTSLRNPRKHHCLNDFTARAFSRLVRRELPSHARFDRKVVTNLVTPKRRLSDATEGACWKAAVRNGHARLLTATLDNSNRITEGRSSSSRVLSPDSPTRPRRQQHLSREWRLRGGRGGPVRRHPRALRAHVLRRRLVWTSIPVGLMTRASTTTAIADSIVAAAAG